MRCVAVGVVDGSSSGGSRRGGSPLLLLVRALLGGARLAVAVRQILPAAGRIDLPAADGMHGSRGCARPQMCMVFFFFDCKDAYMFFSWGSFFLNL